jgi:general stress protein 26
VIAGPDGRTTAVTGSDAATLRALISGISVAMFVTLDQHGRPTSRPMSVIMGTDEPDLWFIAPEQSAVIAEVRACSDVTLIFVRQPAVFVAVTGRAHLHRDDAEVRKLWTPAVGAWVERRESGRAALIHVNVDHVDYWDSVTGAARELNFVRPVATGRKSSTMETLRLH